MLAAALCLPCPATPSHHCCLHCKACIASWRVCCVAALASDGKTPYRPPVRPRASSRASHPAATCPSSHRPVPDDARTAPPVPARGQAGTSQGLHQLLLASSRGLMRPPGGQAGDGTCSFGVRDDAGSLMGVLLLLTRRYNQNTHARLRTPPDPLRSSICPLGTQNSPRASQPRANAPRRHEPGTTSDWRPRPKAARQGRERSIEVPILAPPPSKTPSR